MTIRIAAVGLSHHHIYNQVNTLLDAGAELTWFWGAEPERVAAFQGAYPQARQAREIDEILDDPAVDLVVSAVIPDERAALGMRVMRRGKDYSAAKPAFTSLAQVAEARRVQADTGRLFAVHFGERFESAATVQAEALVRAGAIGRVVHTTGFGPHRFLGQAPRPDWAFDRRYFGGIINDLASHQIDQFIHFTDSEHPEIDHAQVGNFRHGQFPNFEDFGAVTLRSERATGYVRVDWLTPAGLETWGDVRLFLVGTEGSIEVRKNCDLAGRPGGDHLFLIDQQGTRYIDCAGAALTYGARLVADVLNRTQTAMRQDRWFLVSELAVQAQQQAVWVGAAAGPRSSSD